MLTYDKLAEEGLRRLPAQRYDVGSDISEPDAIMLRSHDLHGLELPTSLRAVAPGASSRSSRARMRCAVRSARAASLSYFS